MPAASPPRPLVVQYLYMHGPGEAFSYPTARASPSAAQFAVRYLECALAQVASLVLRETDCDLALATNIGDRDVLGRTGAELMNRIESFGTLILPTPYRHRPGNDRARWVSSRYVFDAILSATQGQPDDRQLWLTDLDCVWPDAARVFASAPSSPEIGCIYIPYPPDWNPGGVRVSSRTIGELAAGMGGPKEVPPWVGGELLTGTPGPLRDLVTACEDLDAELAAKDEVLGTEEQILTLAGALGRVRFRDLSDVAGRIWTGPRHNAPREEDPLSYGLWHLPSEKGLSLRRAARAVRTGRIAPLREDLLDPQRMVRRFNVAGTGLGRRVRDDSWIAAQRIRGTTQQIGRSILSTLRTR
jgi:hypothetical protein